MRGRKPMPVELKLLHGNQGGRRTPKVSFPPRADGEPAVPPGLGVAERAIWEITITHMRACGTLGAECGASLEIYCRNLVRLRIAEAHVAEHGAIVPAPRTGVPMHNPYLSVANKASEIVAKISAEFGFTPSSRGRVSRAEAEGDEFDAYLSQRA